MDNIKVLNRNFIDTTRARKVELSLQISECDLSITDALHYLENEQCDAVGMVKTAKILKELRQKRREIKIEYEQVKKMLSVLSSPGLERYEHMKPYKYRTKVMDGIRNMDKAK